MTHSSQAPLRIDFTGAYTDVEPYASEKGGRAINVAFGFYTRVVWNNGVGPGVVIELSTGRHVAESVRGLDAIGALGLIRALLIESGIEDSCSLSVETDAPHGCGLGASAALGVALRKVLVPNEPSYGAALSAADAERAAGISGGVQDQFASAMGGFLAVRREPSGWRAEPLTPHESLLYYIAQGGFVAHISGNRNSGNLVDVVMGAYRRGSLRTRAALDALNAAAQTIEDSLSMSSELDLRLAVSEVLIHQQELHPAIVSPTALDLLALLKRRFNAVGKVLGGGGAGAGLLILVDPDQRSDAMETALETCRWVKPALIDQVGARVTHSEAIPYS